MLDELLNSPLVEKLKNGELPEVEVSLSEKSLIKLFAGAFFTAVAIMLVGAIIKKI